MRVRHGTLYLANLSPRIGTEPGKLRPVLVIQSDLLNETQHASTWVIPCTTRLSGNNLLRTTLPQGIAGNREECEAMIDQSRAIDNRRFLRALKPVPPILLKDIKEKLRQLGEL